MSFAPALPLSGYAGWRVLQTTLDRQQAAHAQTPQIARETAAFRDRIGDVTSAADLVADRGLLKVGLGAFGLQDDLANSYFVQKVLEDGTLAPDALANRLTDTRYRDMARAFGFGDVDPPNTVLSSFPDDIVAAYELRSFEAAVGTQDEDFRLSLNAQRELATLAPAASSDDTKWYTVLGTPPLRTVFETALGMPEGFAALDLDRQLAEMRKRLQATFGDSEIGQFADPQAREDLIRRFLIQAETGDTATASGETALALLNGTAVSASSVLAALYP
jgi:hypothetical protein